MKINRMQEGNDIPEEVCKVKLGLLTIFDQQCHSTGSPVMTRELNTIDVGFHNARVLTKHVCHLGRRHVLAFPAERITQPITEEPTALLVSSHRISGTVVGVAVLQYAARNLFGRGLFITPIPAEVFAGNSRARLDFDKDLAAILEIYAFHEASLAVADQVAGLGIHGSRDDRAFGHEA